MPDKLARPRSDTSNGWLGMMQTRFFRIRHDEEATLFELLDSTATECLSAASSSLRVRSAKIQVHPILGHLWRVDHLEAQADALPSFEPDVGTDSSRHRDIEQQLQNFARRSAS